MDAAADKPALDDLPDAALTSAAERTTGWPRLTEARGQRSLTVRAATPKNDVEAESASALSEAPPGLRRTGPSRTHAGWYTW